MDEQNTGQAEERAAYTNGLRALADWFDEHPEVPLPWTGTEYAPFQLGVWLSKDELATIVKALPGPVRKRFSDTTLDVHAQIGSVHVHAYAGRGEVCERVVLGVESFTVPAVEAQPERVEEREIVEWRCHPILADAPEPAEEVTV